MEKLAESFPVDERGVKGILRSRPPRTLRSILLQDKEVSNSCVINQGGRGHWAVYYTSPQSFIIMVSYPWINNLWKLLLDFYWLVH